MRFHRLLCVLGIHIWRTMPPRTDVGFCTPNGRRKCGSCDIEQVIEECGPDGSFLRWVDSKI
jgi:hypothetical protein